MKLLNLTHIRIGIAAAFVVLAVVANAAQGALAIDRADLIYDSPTGNVTLDQTEAAGGIMNNFVLKNAVGGNDFNTSVVNFPFSGSLKTDLPTEISQTDPLFAGFTGGDQWSLGAIFPTGMDLSGLQSLLTQNSYVGAPGSGFQDLDLLVTPEPATLGLLLLGGLALLRRRK